MNERTDSWTEDHPEIRFCPLCGSEIEPVIAYSNEAEIRMHIECPNHGEAWVEYQE